MADLAISLVVLAFAALLIPVVWRRDTMPLYYCAVMIVGAIVLTLAYISLGLWLSVAVEAASVVLWAIIARRSFT